MKLYGDKIVYRYKKINSELESFFMKDMLTQNNIKLDQVIQNI